MTDADKTRAENLEMLLCDIACAFRGSDNQEDRRAISKSYEVIFRQLEMIEGWCGEPYLDSQLPDEYMPISSR